MKPASGRAALQRASLRRDGDAAWNERAGRLFGEFERPARTMIRRAFRGAFSADELDDIYAGAWVGTLRALADRQAGLSDEEIRSYLLTAVANQAGKELRRRRRKPTAPLELVHAVPDEANAPDERAASSEQSRVTRDLLASLPPRRRAVMLLRYGWGLEPSQVCRLVKGLSRRAYRKEITRGIEELSAKMRAFEHGEWCAEREPVLRAYAAGLADAEQQRQARAHLAHCHDCTDFVARLHRHLHDLGSAVAVPAIDGLDGHVSLVDRLGEYGDRTREAATSLLARGGGGGADEAVSQVAASGGVGGAGVAGAGVLAKLAGLGAVGKLAVACVGAAAVVPCVNALSGDGEQERDRVPVKTMREKQRPTVTPEVLPTQVGDQPAAADTPGVSAVPEPRPAPAPQSQPEPNEPVEPSEPVPVEEAPSSDFSFGAEPAPAAPAPAAPATASAPATSSSSGEADFGGGGAPQGGDFAFGSQ
jgi:RNA polymerase sigma factor (sigma-70 family)